MRWITNHGLNNQYIAQVIHCSAMVPYQNKGFHYHCGIFIFWLGFIRAVQFSLGRDLNVFFFFLTSRYSSRHSKFWNNVHVWSQLSQTDRNWKEVVISGSPVDSVPSSCQVQESFQLRSVLALWGAKVTSNPFILSDPPEKKHTNTQTTASTQKKSFTLFNKLRIWIFTKYDKKAVNLDLNFDLDEENLIEQGFPNFLISKPLPWH